MYEPEPIECVKCGETNPHDVDACGRCTWPFSQETWSSTNYALRRVTIDTSCINVKKKDPNLNALEDLAAEGKIQLQRSHVLVEELKGRKRLEKAESVDAHPPIWAIGFGSLGIDTNIAGPDLAEPIKDVMFPTANVLTTNQEYDLEHLRSHVLTGGDAFVTRNPRDFVVRGKSQSLSRLGIWVFEPQNLVAFLVELYGWSPRGTGLRVEPLGFAKDTLTKTSGRARWPLKMRAVLQ